MVIASPVVRLDAVELKVSDSRSCELAALSDNLSTCVVLNTLRGLVLCESKELVNKDFLEVLSLCLVLLVNLSKDDLILLLLLTSLDCTREEFLIDYHTRE